MKQEGAVLVTGGAGYIGSHTAVELVEAGYRVVLADDLSNAEERSICGIRAITGVDVPFVRMDCTDREAMRELFTRFPIRAAIHFAARKSLAESLAEPLLYYRNNLDSMLTLLECMRRVESSFVLFSSSATIYGDPASLPVSEQTPRGVPSSPYGSSKQIGEDMLRDAVRAYPGMRGISLRYFNPIGAHPSARIGELPRGVPNNLVPYMTQTAAGLRAMLSIFGNDYPTPDGTCVRDYIDIVDLARAHVAALGRMMEGRQREAYEIFNIGRGRGVSVLELVETFERANGLKLNRRYAERRPGDVPSIWADASLALRELGWQPERSLEETLQASWRWQQSLMHP